MTLNQIILELETLDRAHPSSDWQRYQALTLIKRILTQTQSGFGILTREHRARLLSIEPRWGHYARELQMLLALPESEVQWLECLDASGLQSRQGDDVITDHDSLNEQRLENIYHHLLSLEDVQARSRLWLAFMVRCDEAQRRRLLERQGFDSWSELLPSLAALLRVSGASTRKLILDYIVDAQLVAAEPLLMHVAQDEHEDLHVRNAAINSLVSVGTRQCIALLIDAQREPMLLDNAQEALRAIERRYPAAAIIARSGSLSMMEHEGTRGALSLMGVDAGSISLYEDVLVALSGEPDMSIRSPTSANALRPELVRLGAPPRYLGRLILFTYALLSTNPTMQACWHLSALIFTSVFVYMFLSALGFSLMSGVLASIALSGLLVCGPLLAVGESRIAQELQTLRFGHLTQARRTLEQALGRNDSLRFAFQDERGRTHVVDVPPHLRDHHKLMDEQLQRASYREAVEPVLYEKDCEERAIFLDSLLYVRVGDRGQLELTHKAWGQLVGYLVLFYGVPLTSALTLAFT